MRVHILGSLEAWEDGRELSIGPDRQRALLALLVLHSDETVSADRLIDALWGERPPATAAKVLQGYVSQLRRILPAGAIETRGSGYVLRATETDAAEFERLLDLSRGQAPRDAAQTLRHALDLWRGPPLVDVEYESWAQNEIARLDDLRLTALEERIAADLELGEHGRVVSELESLVAEHPLRERLRAQLMLSLYRSGRQADALDFYARGRKELVEELGIEPGPELQELQRAILAQDPELAPVRQPLMRAARRRAPWLLVAGGVLLAGAASIAGVLLAGGSSNGPIVVAPNSVGVIDPSTNRVVRQIPVGDTPSSVAVSGDAVWVLNSNEDTISRIDAARRSVVKVLGSGRQPIALTTGRGALWVVTASHDLVRIDPDTYLATTSVVPRAADVQAGPVLPSWVASDGSAVWATNDATLARIDPAPRVAVAGSGVACCGQVALGAGSVWTTDASGLTRFDAGTGAREAHVRLPFVGGTSTSALAVGAGSVWVADQDGNSVWRIDTRNNSVIGTIVVGNHPSGLAAGAGAIWAACADGTVSRIDPNGAQGLGRVVRTIQVGGTPSRVAVGDGLVWVSVD